MDKSHIFWNTVFAWKNVMSKIDRGREKKNMNFRGWIILIIKFASVNQKNKKDSFFFCVYFFTFIMNEKIV